MLTYSTGPSGSNLRTSDFGISDKNVTCIAENIAALSESMREFEARYGLPPASVKLLAVSKRHGAASIRRAAAAGIRDFGENYLREAERKIDELADLDLCWHFIGPIQANKTRGIAARFDWVHSVDREKIARRLNDQRRQGVLKVCVQVKLSNEETKSGVALDGTEALCDTVAALPNLELRGLMAIPAPLGEFQAQRRCFRTLADEFRRLREKHPAMDTLSMGMTDDFEAAIAEGSTMIRLGTAIFGPRT